MRGISDEGEVGGQAAFACGVCEVGVREVKNQIKFFCNVGPIVLLNKLAILLNGSASGYSY